MKQLSLAAPGGLDRLALHDVPDPGTPGPGEIRAWAEDNGYEVSDRGRIHQSVKDAYYAAH